MAPLPLRYWAYIAVLVLLLFAGLSSWPLPLNKDKDQLARSLTEKLLAYSTGAAPTKVDKPEIEAIVGRLRDQKYGFKSLIHEIVQSTIFQSK